MTVPSDANAPVEPHTSDQQFQHDGRIGDTVDADNVPHPQHQSTD